MAQLKLVQLFGLHYFFSGLEGKSEENGGSNLYVLLNFQLVVLVN